MISTELSTNCQCTGLRQIFLRRRLARSQSGVPVVTHFRSFGAGQLAMCEGASQYEKIDGSLPSRRESDDKPNVLEPT